MRQLNFRIFSLIVYYDGIPASCILGRYMPRANVASTVIFGGLVGGCPVVRDDLENKAEVRDLSIKALNEALSKMNVGRAHICAPAPATEDLMSALAGNGYLELKVKYSPVLDLAKGKDELWRTADRKNRNVTRFAVKSGVKVSVDNSFESFKDFYGLYSGTAAMKQFRPNSFDMMSSQFKALAKHSLCDLWAAKKDGELLAGAFIWKYRDTVYYAYGASSKAGWNFKASNLLQWEIIERYSGAGFKSYNMWEGSTDRDSPLYDMTAFKLSFGAAMVPTREYVRVNKKLLDIVFSSPLKDLYRKVVSAA